ncbi:FAD-binding protein [Myxococcota bacterium]|nr:FAD-binding protein [Myxococcota bacterium]
MSPDIQNTSKDAAERFCSRLSPKLGDRGLRTDEEARLAASSDESDLEGQRPFAVTFPTCTEEVVEIAKTAWELGLGMVPRGAGSGKAGGVIPGPDEFVIDLSRMNHIHALRTEDLFAEVEAGVITEQLHQATEEALFFYPPDPASFESSTLGGNIATNAGGPRAVKYGVTQRYVWGVEVVLADGRVLNPGRRSIKGVAGYDLTSLFTGSEGTLGIITKANLHIIPAPKAVETAFLFFDSVERANQVAEAIFKAGFLPRMMELLDQAALDAVRPLSSFAIPGAAQVALLIESDGDEDQAGEQLLQMAEVAINNGAQDSAVASSEKDREAMRRARRLVSSALKDLWPYKISDDVAVPRSQMPKMLQMAETLCVAEGLSHSAYGHLGDGNLHLNILCKSAEERAKAQALRRLLLKGAVDLGGTISGEHGIGLAKRDVLGIEQSSELMELQREMKALFDPKGIMNPGKVFK